MSKDDRVNFRAGHDRKQIIKDLERQGLIKQGYLSEFLRIQMDELISHVYEGNGHKIPEKTKEEIALYVERRKKEEAMNRLVKAKKLEFMDMIEESYSKCHDVINGLLADEEFTKAANVLKEWVLVTNDERRSVSPRYIEEFLNNQYEKLLVDGKMEEIIAQRQVQKRQEW